MKHLNNAVVQAASGQNQTWGDLVRNTSGGQIFTCVVIAGAVLGIVYLVFFKRGGGKSDS